MVSQLDPRLIYPGKQISDHTLLHFDTHSELKQIFSFDVDDTVEVCIKRFKECSDFEVWRRKKNS